MKQEDKYITILDEQGVETLAEVIFTFVHDDENYVLLTPTEEFDDVEDFDHEYAVLAYKYEELEDGTIGNLIQIPESDVKAWETVEEMFNTFENTNFEM